MPARQSRLQVLRRLQPVRDKLDNLTSLRLQARAQHIRSPGMLGDQFLSRTRSPGQGIHPHTPASLGIPEEEGLPQHPSPTVTVIQAAIAYQSLACQTCQKFGGVCSPTYVLRRYGLRVQVSLPRAAIVTHVSYAGNAARNFSFPRNKFTIMHNFGSNRHHAPAPKRTPQAVPCKLFTRPHNIAGPGWDGKRKNRWNQPSPTS